MLNLVLPGLLVICALVVLLNSVIRAEAAARPVLAQARLDLFGDSRAWYDQPMRPHPYLLKWEKHPLYPEYLRIYHQEHLKAWRRIGKGFAIFGFLILIAAL